MMGRVIRLLVTEKSNAVSNAVIYNAVIPITGHGCIKQLSRGVVNGV